MRRILVLGLAAAFALGACGSAATPSPAPATQAPVASMPATPTTAPAAAAIDMKAVVTKFLTGLPDKYLSIGTVDALKEAMNAGALVVDVREPSEYTAGHIPGAINVPLRTIVKSLDVIPTDKTVVMQCKTGYRAAMATTALGVLGYANVRSFTPSFAGWQAANEKVVTDAVQATKVTKPAIDPALVAKVDQFVSAIPDGYWGVGTVDAFKSLQASGMQLFDVREPSEFAAGRIPGAVNVPIRTLPAKLDLLGTDKPLLFYCASNHRAAMTVTALQLLGYANARVFSVNINGWKAAGEKIEQ